MAYYETRTLSEILSAAAFSFDPDLWDYAFERTVPIAIYVDAADDESREIAEIIENRLNRELTVLGFESPESLSDYSGSFLKLNLSKAPKTDTGPRLGEKLQILRTRLVSYLKGEFFQDLKQGGKDATKILKIAIGIGTIVLLLTTAPAGGFVVGGFVVSAKAWVILGIAKESTEIVEVANKLLTESPEAKASPNRGTSHTDPVIIQAPSEKQLHELTVRLDEQQSKIRELEEALRSSLKKP